MSQEVRIKWKKRIYIIISLVFWLCLWQYAATRLDKSIFLPYPKAVWESLVELARSESFFVIVKSSLLHIAQGFLLGLLLGLGLAVVCSFSDFVAALLMPVLKLIKTVPVVSFVILVLLWVDAEKISIVISFLIVLPVIYENVRRGIRETDPKLLEMSRVFSVGFRGRLRYIFLPTAIPYSTAACSVGLSLCWKAGIAAEIIGLSADSIGRQLYDAKLYLDTAALFAWTIVVIVVSVAFEWAVMVLLRLVHVWLADETLLYHRRKMFRFVLGLPPTVERTETVADDGVYEERNTMMKTDDKEQNATLEPTRIEACCGEVPIGEASGATESFKSARGNENTEATAPKFLLRLSDITKSYDGREVLSGISLELRTGDVLLLRGASGCGKTTLLRILLGLTKADGGRREAGDGVAMAAVFQEDRLCEAFSAWKNIALTGNAPEKESVCRALDELGIREPVRKPVREFSGGMKRRVAWLRALLAPWEVLVLDEPFTGLDAERTRQMLAQLKARVGQGAIVIVTHNTSEIPNLYEHFPEMKELTLEKR